VTARPDPDSHPHDVHGGARRPAAPPVPAAPTTPADEPAVLPDRTRDESDVGWGAAEWRDATDHERYLRERPPHWE